MYMFSIRYMQMRALLVILEKPSYLTWKQFSKNKPSCFLCLASLSTCAECISDYKVSAGKRQVVTRRRQDFRLSEEPTFTGSSLASVGHSHCASSTEVEWRWTCGINGQWSSTVSAYWGHTEQAPISCCLAGGWNDISTFIFSCGFCAVISLLCPDKRRCHVDGESQDWVAARHGDGCISRTLAHCICPGRT